MLQVLEGRNGAVTRVPIQHAVIAAKLVLNPWTAPMVDALSDRVQRRNDDGGESARLCGVALGHSSTMPHSRDGAAPMRASTATRQCGHDGSRRWADANSLGPEGRFVTQPENY